MQKYNKWTKWNKWTNGQNAPIIVIDKNSGEIDNILDVRCSGNFSGAGSTLQDSFYDDVVYGVIDKCEIVYPAPVDQNPFTYNNIGYSTGSSAGINQVINGITLFGGTDLPPTDTQLVSVNTEDLELLTFPIVLFGLTLIYNIPGFTETLNLTSSKYY